MITRRSALLAAAAAAIPSNAIAQTQLRGSLLRTDIDILQETYETLHPGLYRYNTPARMRARFEALRRDWSADQTRAQAYLSLSRFLASIQCGHTYANFYNQSEAVRAELFDPWPRLPFQFLWLDGRMVVDRNLSEVAMLSPGAEILAVNGHSTRAILRTLMPFARADGANDDKRRALLAVRGLDDYETFDLFYGLYFRPGAVFRLSVRPYGDRRVHDVDVPGIGLAARRASRRITDVTDSDGGWTLSFPRPTAALLTMPNWVMYNSRWDWRGFLDNAFEQIQARGATKLIVDIRGNEGGNDCGDDVIARLIDTPRTRENYERRVRYVRTPPSLDRYLDTWDDTFRNWGADAEPLGDGFYRLAGSSGEDAIAPKPPRFAGDVLVLTDAQNSSATAQFANAIQSGGLGRLVGQTTGGNRRGINGGGFFFLRLPASGLEADVPLIGRFPLTGMPNQGIVPDIGVEPTRADLAAGRDVVLETALEA